MKYFCLVLCLALSACGPPENMRPVPSYNPPVGDHTKISTVKGYTVASTIPLFDNRTVWITAVDGLRVGYLRPNGRRYPSEKMDWNNAVAMSPGARVIQTAFQYGNSFAEATIPFIAQPGHSYRLDFKAYSHRGYEYCDTWVVDAESHVSVSPVKTSNVHGGMLKRIVVDGD